MAKTIELDNISFTKVVPITGKQALPGRYGNGSNGEFDDADTDGVKPFVNAVEIDWNGAQIGES